MSSRDDRLRIQHMRIENEKDYIKQKKRLEADLGYKFTNISKEEDAIRKQHERLENEKQYNKSHSHLLKDRRLSLPAKESTESSQSPTTLREVKSKLFDYAKSSPRSRRQLIESGKTTPMSPTPHGLATPRSTTPRGMATHAIEGSETRQRESGKTTPRAMTPRGLATHAIEGNKASHRDIVHHLTLQTDRPSRRDLSADRSPTPTLQQTALEREASRRSINQPEHRVVTFTEDNSMENTAANMANKYKRRHTEPAPLIHVIDVNQDDASDDQDDTMKLQDLYNKAIETVKQADESYLSGPNEKTRPTKDLKRFSDPRTRSGFDINALKELEHILNDARNYISRKSSKEDHSRLDLGSNRAQKKRIQHLEQVLKLLNPNYGDSNKEMDPFQVLQCSYLRLSKSNIQTLEDMIRHDGKEPGIHIHSDVTDYDIWEHIQQERNELPAGEDQQS